MGVHFPRTGVISWRGSGVQASLRCGFEVAVLSLPHRASDPLGRESQHGKRRAVGARRGASNFNQPADSPIVTPTKAIVPSRNTRSATEWSLPPRADPIALVASDGDPTF